MKQKLLLLTVIILFSTKLFAQSNFILFSQEGEKFWVVLNGIKQNADPQTNVKVTGLNGNAYKMKVIFADNKIPDIDKTIYFNEPGEYTYNVKKNSKGEYVARFLSSVPIAQAPAPPADQVIVVYTTVAPVSRTTTTHTTTTTGENPDNIHVDMNVGGVGVNMNVNGMDAQGNTTTTTHSTTTTTTTTTSGYHDVPPATIIYVPGYAGPIGCPVPMAPSDFDAAKHSIAAKDFESTKLSMAKQIVGSNCIVAEQVKEIMHLFDFETSKVDFAKFAYSHTYDKGNYFKVNDAFEYDSSVSELNSYIGK